MKNKGKTKEELINELAELRQRVADLEKSETRREQEFRALAENAPDIIAQFDKELRHIYVNLAIESTTGISRDSFIGKTNRELGMPENLNTLWDKALRTVFETGQETTIEFDFPTPDGQRYFESRLAPEFAKDGSVESVLVISRNITERKRVEKKLRESEEKFRLIATHSPDVVFFQDCDLRYIWIINPAPPHTEEQVIGKTDFDLLRREEAERLIEIKRTILDTGTGARVEIPLIIGGKKYYYNAVYEPTRDHEGKIMGIFGYAHNITDHKLAEEAMRESEERLRLAQEVAHVGTFDWNIVTGVNTWTPELEAMYGLPPGGFAKTQSAWVSLVHPEDRAQALRKVETAFETGKPVESEWRVVWPDGSVHWLAGRWQMFKDESGQPLRMMGVNIDITERKRAEEALRKAHDELELRVQERTAELEKANKALLESEASYRELTESIDDPFCAMDRELRYTYWNKASEALTGILAKDAIGKSLYELFPDIKGTKVEEFYIEALKTQQPGRLENEYQLGNKKFIFEINAYPTNDGLSVIVKDITGKKMLEAHLLRAQRMESIGILAGGIAHNLNNLLTPMMMSLRMLKEKLKDEQSQKLLTILERNSQRSADLIKQVLSFSRGVEGERAPLHIANLVTEIEKIAKETFPRNIEIRTDMPVDIWTISGDETQLHQVLMNLCVNARDAMPDGGILSISAENVLIDENYAQTHTEAKVGPYVAISISDTGVGIPPKIVDRIFEPFFTTKEFGKGTGLGLSTAHAIVRGHGGFIDVHSEIRKGTKFRVYLPAIVPELQNVEQQLELPVGHGELVLVAEDEDAVREVTISTLEKYGYSVLAASDGAQAVALYAQSSDKIRIILMDMMMPVMDGHASIRAIRKINPEVRIIAVSGLDEKDRLRKVADYTNFFLPKPYTAEKLLKNIHEVLSA